MYLVLTSSSALLSKNTICNASNSNLRCICCMSPRDISRCACSFRCSCCLCCLYKPSGAIIVSLLSLKIHALSLKISRKRNHTNFRLLSYNHNPLFLTPPPVASGTTTRSLLHRSPSPSAGLHRLPSMLPSPYYKPQGRRYNSRCAKVRSLPPPYPLL